MAKIPKSKLVKVAAQDLRIHPLAQRQLVPSKLKKIKDSLDLDAIGVLHAVEYPIEGVTAKWIIDGQHRWKALIDHGLGEWEVEVKLHIDATDHARASELFLRLNDRSPVGPFAKFSNELTANHADAVGVRSIVHDFSLKITPTGDDGKICCVSAAKKLYQIDNGVTFRKALRTLIAAYGRTASAVEGKLLEGMGIVFKTYNGAIDEGALVKKLAKHPGGASGLIGDGKGVREFKKASLSRCIAEVIVSVYNSGRRAGKLDPL